MPSKKIIEISVRGLFGYIDFKISAANLVNDKFYFAYAENGLGKTTVLNLVYSLLSHEPNEGNKGYIYRQRFKSISVIFEDGSKICAERGSEGFEGEYNLLVVNPDGEEVAGSRVDVSSSGRVTPDSAPELPSFYAEVESLTPSLVYLRADRYVRRSFTHHRTERYLSRNREISPRRAREMRADDSAARELFKQLQIDNLLDQLSEFRGSILDRLFSSQSVGLRSSEAVFQRVVSSLSRKKDIESATKSRAISQIVEIKQRSANAIRLGLSSEDQFDAMIKLFESVDGESWGRVQDVASLYVETASQRFENISRTADSLAMVLDDLNSYFSHKEAIFTTADGLVFVDKLANQPIDPEHLSSGERQLVSIFTLLGVDRRGATFVMIDEPEISLSTVWQKKLSNSMKVLAGDKDAQYLIATHSIELLSDKVSSVAVPMVNA